MDRSEICDRFLDSIEFELYPFQEEALLAWFDSDRGMMLCAPTGMGKTLIAEAAIFEALHTKTRLYYTTPLVALTDQKFRDLQDKAETWGFPRSHIGLLTGNRRVNPDAPIRVVVAEILLNHLLAGEGLTSAGAQNDARRVHGPASLDRATLVGEVEGDGLLKDVRSVVIDEFHYFNDFERGVVWELTLVLMPRHVRLMLLSATVGNPVEFLHWLRDAHGQDLQLIRTEERKVPLEYTWIPDKLLTEQLPSMVAADDAENRTPALVFCFNRDDCWGVAERLKGLKLIDQTARGRIEEVIDNQDFMAGVGPKLKQMLICGVGVHHAGVLPKHKEVVEDLFLRKLIPFVVCTETLAAGINLPARSVVISKLLKGKPGDEKLISSSAAHQMFGRAGRPQYDKRGYVYSLAHEDDVKIVKWRKKYDQLDQHSKDPGILRARKQLERKRPTRRKTQRYWSEGQFKTVIEAGPANLYSRSMIPYQVLVYLLTRRGGLAEARSFLSKRFNTAERISMFQSQLDRMIGNLATFGYLTRDDDGEHVTLDEKMHDLLTFRSVDPLYGVFLVRKLVRADLEEKIQALESVLALPPAIEKSVRLPDDLTPGPLQTQVLEPELVQMGIVAANVPLPAANSESDDADDDWAEEEKEEEPVTLPEMLKALFDAKLETPEDVLVQPKWVFGGILEQGGDFYKFTRARNLVKNEGLILRHLLRLTILASEFAALSDGDPDYVRIGELATTVCQKVDTRYTDRYLAAEEEAKQRTQL